MTPIAFFRGFALSASFKLKGWQAVCHVENCGRKTHASVYWGVNAAKPTVFIICERYHAKYCEWTVAKRLEYPPAPLNVVQKALQIIQDSNVPFEERKKYADQYEALMRGGCCDV